MLILFDLQEKLENVTVGCIGSATDLNGFVRPWGDPAPKVSVKEYDDVKFIGIENRVQNEAGVDLYMSEINELKPGDRITITGRVGQNAPLANWGVGLFVKDGTGTHLNQHLAPVGLYSITHLVDASEIGKNFIVRTVQWGEDAHAIDFYVDSVLVTRPQGGELITKDERKIVYSLNEDVGIKNARLNATNFESTSYLMRSGTPEVSVVERNGIREVYVTGRVRDWDAIDILVSSMELMRGNQYRIKVKGELGTDAPGDTQMTFQGVPGYAWRGNVQAQPGGEFVLEHLLTQSDIENWTSVRITTNSEASRASFTIKSIEVLTEGTI